MRLRTILRGAPKSILDALEGCGIKSTEDFVFSPIDHLYQALPPNTIPFADFEDLRDRVVEHLASEGKSAGKNDSSAVQSISTTLTNVTGHNELDELLAAVTPGIIEISGGNDAQNTLLALNIALSYLVSEPSSLVYWIDTSGIFSPDQAHSVLRKLINMKPTQFVYPIESILERLRVSLVFELEAAHHVLEEIKNTKSDGVSERPCLIVVDSITSLLSPHLSSVTKRGHALMSIFMRSLQDVAAKYGMIVLVLNKAVFTQPPHSTTSIFASTKLKPALGPYFTFLSNTTLWLSRGADVLDEITNARGDGTSTNPLLEDDGIEELLIVEVVRSRSSKARIWWPVTMKDDVLQEKTSLALLGADRANANRQT